MVGRKSIKGKTTVARLGVFNVRLASSPGDRRKTTYRKVNRASTSLVTIKSDWVIIEASVRNGRSSPSSRVQHCSLLGLSPRSPRSVQFQVTRLYNVTVPVACSCANMACTCFLLKLHRYQESRTTFYLYTMLILPHGLREHPGENVCFILQNIITLRRMKENKIGNRDSGVNNLSFCFENKQILKMVVVTRCRRRTAFWKPT